MNAMNDNFAENLAKPCQKADQPAQVTEVAVLRYLLGFSASAPVRG